MAKILILFAHPVLEKSVANIQLIEAVSDLPGVKIVDLYEEYPDFNIDVPAQQELLLESDLILFQHPLYWYSAPSLLKEWCDLVLEYGFAYGEKGTALVGKKWMHAITTGGHESAYSPEGVNRYPLEEFLKPWSQTAYLCGMEFLPPFVFYGSRGNPNSAKVVAAQYRKRVVELLREGQNG